MNECWNCRRPCDRYTRSCPYCGAALPVTFGPEPPPAPEPVAPAPAPEPARRPPPRPRSDFQLNDPGTLRERAAETTGFYAEKAAQEIDHLQALLQAMRKNAQATALLVVCVCVVAYIGLVEYKVEDLGTVDAASMQQAMDGQLFQRQAVPSFNAVSWNGRNIKVEEAWIAQVGKYTNTGMFSKTIVAVPSGQYRMYFRITVTGGAETFQMTTGEPPHPVGKLNLVRDGAPVVLRYIDLPSFVNPSQSIIIQNPAHPEDGVARLVIH